MNNFDISIPKIRSGLGGSHSAFTGMSAQDFGQALKLAGNGIGSMFGGIIPKAVSGNLGSSGSSNYSGLGISDQFGDYIRDLQQQAASEQQAYQTLSAQTAMQFSADEAQKNRDFQEYMSSTAYQRATEDMRKAGLNPILAVSGGFGGASTPAGSAASGIAQTGAMASVSELNSGLEALSTYLEALVSAGDVASKFLNDDDKSSFIRGLFD